METHDTVVTRTRQPAFPESGKAPTFNFVEYSRGCQGVESIIRDATAAAGCAMVLLLVELGEETQAEALP